MNPASMKGVVLAGGTGSRLLPLTRVTNKHLLPVGPKPMVFWPLEKLREAEITDVLLVTGREHMGDVMELLGSGREMGLNLTYRVQDEAGGIAQALGLAEGFAGGSPVCVLLADNIFEDPLRPHVQRYDGRGAMILLKEVPDPARFGVAEFAAPAPGAGESPEPGARIERIVEKPSSPPSRLAVTGIYFYGANVFELVRDLKPSARGELEITDVNNAYLRRGELAFGVLEGYWSDAGTEESYSRANAWAWESPT